MKEKKSLSGVLSGTPVLEKSFTKAHIPWSPNGSPDKKVKETAVEESPSKTPFSAPSYVQPSLDASKVKSAVQAVLKLLDDYASKKTTLFSDDAHPIHMQVTSVKVAHTPERLLRFALPHTLVNESSDVCLFVADLKKGKKEDHEPTVAHYQDLLERNDITGISKIIPVRQLKVEYDQFEMKRRLCDQFDYFLSDVKVSGHIRHLLGKSFIRKRKFPTPIKLNVANLKKEFKRALSKTVLALHGNGNTTSVTVGLSKQSPEQIVENITAVVEGLAREYPGGWNNIRSLSLKGTHTLAVPIYLTLKSSNMVEVPVVKPKRPKAAVAVEDELSTFVGANVKVLPSGEVIVKRVPDEDQDSDDELDEIIKESTTAQASQKKGKKKKLSQKKEKSGQVKPRSFFLNNRFPFLKGDGGLKPFPEPVKTEALKSDDDDEGQKEKKNKKTKRSKKAMAVTVKEESDDEEEKVIDSAETAYLSHMFRELETNKATQKPVGAPPGDVQGKKDKNKRKNKPGAGAEGQNNQKKQKLNRAVSDTKSFMKTMKKNANVGLKMKNKKVK